MLYPTSARSLHSVVPPTRNTSLPQKLPKDEGDSSCLKGHLRTFGSVSQWCSTDYNVILYYILGTAVAQWLRWRATNRKVAGSIPDGVIGIFH